MGVESTGNYHKLWLQIAYMTGNAIKLGLVEDFETGEVAGGRRTSVANIYVMAMELRLSICCISLGVDMVVYS